MNKNTIRDQLARELLERLYIICAVEIEEGNERIEEIYLEFNNLINKEYLIK